MLCALACREVPQVLKDALCFSLPRRGGSWVDEMVRFDPGVGTGYEFWVYRLEKQQDEGTRHDGREKVVFKASVQGRGRG